MLDASLCNVVGSPISPPDGQWAELHPGMQASVNSRPEPKQATEAAAAVPTPAEETMLRAQQALLSARVGSSSCPAVSLACYLHLSDANALASGHVRFLANWLWRSEHFSILCFLRVQAFCCCNPPAAPPYCA